MLFRHTILFFNSIKYEKKNIIFGQNSNGKEHIILSNQCNSVKYEYYKRNFKILKSHLYQYLFQNPQSDIQAQDRCHRMGQSKPVVVYRLCTKNTIDDRILARAGAKRKLEKILIGSGNNIKIKKLFKYLIFRYKRLNSLNKNT